MQEGPDAYGSTRFEAPPGRQLQIDFGERLVAIGGAKVKAFVFVATLGHSRRLHVRAFRAERQEHWFAGLESIFTTLGGMPEEVLMDNPRASGACLLSEGSTITNPGGPVGYQLEARHW